MRRHGAALFGDRDVRSISHATGQVCSTGPGLSRQPRGSLLHAIGLVPRLEDPGRLSGGRPGFQAGQCLGSVLRPRATHARNEIKVAWRMTGAGAFSFRASDATGKVAPLAWGPVGHDSSEWNHRGDEVGTGFSFPHVGCWDIHVARSDTSADLWLEVTA